MNKSIEKFQLFLKDIALLMSDQAIDTLIKSRNNVINETEAKETAFTLSEMLVIISAINDAIDNEKDLDVYDDFEMLSELLELSKLKPNDVLNILMYFIKRNVAIPNSNEYLALDMYKLQCYNFKTFTKLELNRAIAEDSIKKMLNTPDELLSNRQLEQKRELLEKIDLFVLNVKPIVDISRDIDVLYKNDLTELDKTKIMALFRRLKVKDVILSKIEIVLDKMVSKNTLRKKIEQEQIELSKIKEVKEKKDTKKYISDEEYKRIQKEIRCYYNLHDMELVKIPNYEETLYIASLMYLININEYEIRRFVSLALSNIEEKVYSNPISEYLELKEKIEYYYREDSQEVEEYYNQLSVTEGEEYELYCELIAEYLSLHKISNNDIRYELNKAKELSLQGGYCE